MEGLAKDSWEFVVDRATDRDAATMCPALAIVSKLFWIAERGSAGGCCEEFGVGSIQEVAERVLNQLIPHLGWLVERVVELPDLAKTPCLYAITCLMTNVFFYIMCVCVFVSIYIFFFFE